MTTNNKSTANSQAIIKERRERVWTLLTRGTMKGYEIARELNVSPPKSKGCLGYSLSINLYAAAPFSE